ncbi:DNA replication and repair protein RecF [Marinobacterium zhoushanense]|uniref:DNA replication and repair protein RecF n=1 Tax=Marinobacterium zhoushanense TaxID=1679163 RepID=A0ABQ1KXE7_9GAMM|nr:DNA replication/repair protein RecF [Marinobacterium zhoushanense]GGC10582.1 DNA replication and repair protein RecF [Marinobacterium zhoushanense]
MLISQLQVRNVRNLSAVELQPASRINLLYGENGSGKTSLLEAIHLLGLGRSFRTQQYRQLIQSERDELLVFSQIDPFNRGESRPLGVSRAREGELRVRYAGESIGSAELASLMPLLVINSDTFALLEGSPSVRRQFIDWGGFHSDPGFIRLWRGFHRVLKQRNSLLKCGKIDSRVRALWDTELVAFAEPLTALRSAYVEALIPVFEEILSELLSGVQVQLRFSAGWDAKRSLAQVLEENFERDLRQGFSSSGPQRADLRFRVEGQDAAERLSRGQKKLVVSALKLAQGALFHRQSQRACVYLIDDLPSELDERHCRQFCRFLEKSANQCFITCVDPGLLSRVWKEDTALALFRVDQGTISQSAAPGE